MTRPRSWRRLTTALALASVLVVGCWWMLDARSPRSGAVPTATLEVVAESPPTQAADLVPIVTEPPRVEVESEPAPEPAEESVSVPEEQPATPHFLVQVVDPEGQPLAGIPVAVKARYERARSRYTSTATTGASGESARLEVPAQMLEDAWNKDGALHWFVGVNLHPETTPKIELLERPNPGDSFRFVLEPGLARWLEPLRVRVIDELGDPAAGVPVAFVFTKDGIPVNVDRETSAVTRAPDGVVELPWGDRFENWELIRAVYPAMGMGVTLDLPLRSPPFVLFETEGDAPGPIDIVLSPMGWIELTVTGEGVGEVKGSWKRTDADSPSTRLRTFTGVAGEPLRIGPLGLGWQVAIDVRDPRPGGSSAKLELQSPERKREVLSRAVHLEGAPTPITFTASLVDSEGDPLGENFVTISLRRRDSSRTRYGYAQFALDPDGALVWESGLSAAGLAALEAGVLGVDIHVSRRDRGGSAGEIAVTLASNVPLAELGKLGTLALQPEEPEPAPAAMRSISGRIVDEFGAGIERARVRLHTVQGESQRASQGMRRTDAEGRFTFDGVPDLAVQWTLSADCEMYIHASVTGALTELGGHVLVLPSAGSVECQLLVDPGVSSFDLKVTLTRTDSRRPGGRLTRSEFDYVRPGVYQLTARINDSQWTLVTVPDIKVEAGRVTSDPRIEELDLRGLVRKLRLKLTSAGQTVEVRHFSLKDPEGAGTRDPSTGPDGRAAVPVPTRVEQFTLKAKGYLPVELTWRPDEQTVVLYPE